MTPYVRFCSCQLSAAALLQQKTENNPQFVEVHKVSDDVLIDRGDDVLIDMVTF